MTVMDASIFCKKCEMKTRHTRDEKKRLNACCICGTEVKFKKKDFLVETLQRWHDGKPEGEAAGLDAEREAYEKTSAPKKIRKGRKGRFTDEMKAEICRRLAEKEKAAALAKEFGCKAWTIYSLARQGREFLKGTTGKSAQPSEQDPTAALRVARAIAHTTALGAATPAQIGEALLVIINVFSERLALAKLATWKGKLR